MSIYSPETDITHKPYKLRPGKIFIISVVGTTLMTLFSYWLSWLFKDNFREPQLLALFISNILPHLTGWLSSTLSWTIHYVAGYSWAIVYFLMARQLFGKTSLPVSILMGGIFGIIASYAWLCCFSVIENAPDISYGFYYLQLILGHVIVIATCQLFAKHAFKSDADTSHRF
jgi:hypothetical protein